MTKQPNIPLAKPTLPTPPKLTPKKLLMWLIALSYIAFLITIIVLANKGSLRAITLFMTFIPYSDKIGHFILLGLASFVVNLALGCKTFTLFQRPFLLGSAIVATLITLEEFSQIFIATRGFELSDMISNWLGILCFGQLVRYLWLQDQKELDARHTPPPQ